MYLKRNKAVSMRLYQIYYIIFYNKCLVWLLQHNTRFELSHQARNFLNAPRTCMLVSWSTDPSIKIYHFECHIISSCYYLMWHICSIFQTNVYRPFNSIWHNGAHFYDITFLPWRWMIPPMVVHPKKINFAALCNDLIDYFIVCFEHQCHTMRAV